MTEYTPAQKFQLAAERIEIERRKMREMAVTVRMRTESSENIMRELMAIVCDCFGVSKEDLIGTSRLKRHATARHAYCYLCNKLDPYCTLKKIGDSLDRDHSTVINSCKKCDDLRATDYHFAATFDLCLERVADSNKAFMKRIQFHPEQIENSYEEKKTELQKAMAALNIVHDFMMAFRAHDIREQDGELDHVQLIADMQRLRKTAAKNGF